MDLVKDYKASGSLKTDVSFLKIPVARVNVFYKKPDQFKIKKEGGISLLPKGGVSVNMNALMATGDFVAVDAGESTINGVRLKVIKLLPVAEESDIILSTLYIDEKALLIRKAVTTTRENGTYQMEMQYGGFAQWGLPDKVVLSFDTKDYKLPKGVTFEYEAGEKPVNKGRSFEKQERQGGNNLPDHMPSTRVSQTPSSSKRLFCLSLSIFQFSDFRLSLFLFHYSFVFHFRNHLRCNFT